MSFHGNDMLRAAHANRLRAYNKNEEKDWSFSTLKSKCNDFKLLFQSYPHGSFACIQTLCAVANAQGFALYSKWGPTWVENKDEPSLFFKKKRLRSLEHQIKDLVAKNAKLEKENRDLKVDMGVISSSYDPRIVSKARILSTRSAYMPLCGVYFLIREGEIVYVGQSVDIYIYIYIYIYSRVSTHRKSEKDFDSFSFVCCERHELDDLESAYIIKFKPEYNINAHGCLTLPVNRHELQQRGVL